MQTFKNCLTFLAGIFFLLMTSCKEDKPDPSPAPAFKLEKVSGDNQRGFPNKPLSEPLKVKLLNQDGAAEANKEVEFSVVTGSGTLSRNRVTTDQNGEAQVTWALGPTAPVQSVKATLLDSDNQPVSSTEVVFNAKFQVIKTVAGGNGLGAAANQLEFPYGIFVDGGGNIYVVDKNNHRIQKWAPGANSGVTIAGGNGAGNAANQLNEPYDVSVDNSGNIYIADARNHRIQKWAPGTNSGVTVAGGNGKGNAANQLYDPYDVYVDGGGNIYVADKFYCRIQKWAPGAKSGVTVAGGNGAGNAENQLYYPLSVFVDKSSNIYISDFWNHRVQMWLP